MSARFTFCEALFLACTIPVAFAEALPLQRLDIQVDHGRPLAGERSCFACAPGGQVFFTYSLAAGKMTYIPLGTISSDGRVSVDALSSENTWNVEGWGTRGRPFALAFGPDGSLRFAVRHHGKPYGVDYWDSSEGRWRLESFGQNVSFGGNCLAMVSLPDGSPAIACLKKNPSQLAVWTRHSNGPWAADSPAELRGVAAGDFDMVSLEDGRVLIVTCMSKGGPVAVTGQPSGKWQRVEIDAVGRCMMIAMARNADGFVHLTYAAGVDSGHLTRLRHATLAPGGQWHCRTLYTVEEGRHVSRTDIAATGGTVAIAWEKGIGPAFRGKDYGGRTGSLMLTLLRPNSPPRTIELVAENAGRPGIALSPSGKTAYIGAYTGNKDGDDFYLLACDLDGKGTPKVRLAGNSPEDVFARGCLRDIESGDPAAVSRGLRQINMTRLKPEDRLRTIRNNLISEDSHHRAFAARELAHSADILARLSDLLPGILQDPRPIVRQFLYAHLCFAEKAAEPVTQALLGALSSTAAIDRVGSAYALRQYRPVWQKIDFSPALEELVEDLANPDRHRSGSAAMALMLLKDHPQTVALVRNSLASDHPTARINAAKILFRIGQPFDPGDLADTFQDGSEADQLGLCGILSRMRNEESVRMLNRAIESEYAAVRNAAVFGLRSAGFTAVPAPVAKHPNGMDLRALRLKDKLDEKEAAVRAAAISALEQALDHADPNVRQKACGALNRIGAVNSVPQLQTLKNVADPGVRDSATLAAAILSGRPAGQYLLNLDDWYSRASERKLHHLNPVSQRPIEEKDGVLMIGGQKQLFLDDLVISGTRGLEKKLHPFKKHPRNPVFQAQVPWEEGWADPFMSTVLYDEEHRCFKLWYRCGPRHSLGGFAVSEDGVHWQRPDIARGKWLELEHHNLLGYRGKIAIHQYPGRNINFRPEAKNSARRYSSVGYRHDKKYVVSFSENGVDWSNPVAARTAHGDVLSVVWDPSRQDYLFFPKYMRPSDGFTRRSFSAAAIPHFAAPFSPAFPFLNGMEDDGLVADGISRSLWNLLPNTMRMDQFHTETYSVTAIPYQGLVVALYDLWTVWGSREGSLDMLMKVSRDMVHWQDVQKPERALEIGHFGEWDAGMVYGGNTMLVIDDEIRLYYLGANRGHSTAVLPLTKPWHTLGMGLASLRLDGFVSLQAGRETGVVTTRPMKFKGRELVINASCKSGELRAEILDEKGRPIPGFRKAESDPFRGDDLRHTMTWEGKSDVSPLQTRPVRLRLHLRNGDLYAFWFR